jgi:hypothetical protein
MINRRGEGFVGKQGDNVYAGRDGNVYRRDDNGNWSKWDNGQWNPQNSVRDSMMNESARQRERQQRPSGSQGNQGQRTGERLGNNSTGARPSQLDSTYRNLDRDGAARREGAQRSRDYGTYSNRGTSNPGSYRGGGFGGGMRGGGMRGGGRRR